MREELAEVQHEIWSHWMKYLFSQCVRADDGWTIPSEKVTRWVRQINTPYSELSEKEKGSDREQADKILAVLGDIA